MKNMTYSDALTIAINSMTDTTVVERLTALKASLAKRSSRSDEAKAAANERRKAKNAEARAQMVSDVAPILRAHMTTPITAKALYESAKDELPADFTAGKVQAMLLRELRPELDIIQIKGKANTYVAKS